MTTAWDAQYKSGRGIRFWPNEAVLGFAARRFPDPEPFTFGNRRALDIGCGAGGNLIALGTSGFAVTGVDLSPTAVKFADEWVSEFPDVVNPRIFCGSIFEPEILEEINNDIHGKNFDAIVEVTCLQHLEPPDQQRMIAVVHALLRPDGWFFSQALTNGTTDYAGIFPGNPPIFPVCEYQIRDWLRDAGFRRVETQLLDRSYSVNGRREWAEYVLTEAQK